MFLASAHLSAADGFLIAMLVMMTLSLSVIAVLVLCMRRNVAKRDREVDKLLEEVADEEQRREKRTAPRGEMAEPKPWERDGDWWKK